MTRVGVILYLSLLLAPAAPGGISEDQKASTDALQVRYVANAGMLVTLGRYRFLIDAPIRDGIAPYPTSPSDERVRLEAARSPYDNVDAILVTHWHDDHFSAEARVQRVTVRIQSIIRSL